MDSQCVQCQTLVPPRQKYCTNRCQIGFQYRAHIVAWKSGSNGNSRHGVLSRHVRRYLIEESGGKCILCGWGKVNPTTGRVPLTVDHKDGNWRNNSPNNLQVICPCCHSLTPTYGSLNRGRGRHSYFQAQGRKI